MSLAQKISTHMEARIWAASFDVRRNAFRVAMENGRIFLLARPIPEDDQSEVLEVYLEGDGEVFTVIQASGNEFSVPWDVIEPMAGEKPKKADPKAGKRIGQRVKALRKERGLTQSELAKRSGIKRPNISRLENGNHLPGIPLMERLAAALQVTIGDLLAA